MNSIRQIGGHSSRNCRRDDEKLDLIPRRLMDVGVGAKPHSGARDACGLMAYCTRREGASLSLYENLSQLVAVRIGLKDIEEYN